MLQNQIKYDNNLTLIDSLSNLKNFEYLKGFKLVLEKLNKVNIFKSANYNINLPVESEINLLINYEKKNETSKIIALLMRLIKPARSSFKFNYGKLIVINLNNGSKCFVRLLLFENKIKDVINIKHLTNIPDIYNEYQNIYSYINENFINMDSKISNENKDNDFITIFGELLYLNKYIYDLCFEHNNVKYYDVINNELILIDKNIYKTINDNINEENENDKYKKNYLDIQTRINIFENFLKNIKNTNNPEKYISQVLNDLRNVSEYNLFTDNDNELLIKKKKKVNDILFNKLSPLVSFILILQPFSLCDISYLLFLIDEDYILSKKIQFNEDQNNNNEEIKLFTAQQIISNISDYIVTADYQNNIDDLIHEYTLYFYNDEKLAYKMVWLILISYHIEHLLYDCRNDYKKINNDNIKSYIKLFGIKQYSRGDFYKKRIDWIFELFNDDKNSELLLPNLFKYSHWIIMDNDKNEFLMNLYNDNNVDSETSEIDSNFIEDV